MNEASEKLAVWCAGEGWRPITTPATLIDKKVTPRHRPPSAGKRPLGFNALKEEADGIP